MFPNAEPDKNAPTTGRQRPRIQEPVHGVDALPLQKPKPQREVVVPAGAPASRKRRLTGLAVDVWQCEGKGGGVPTDLFVPLRLGPPLVPEEPLPGVVAELADLEGRPDHIGVRPPHPARDLQQHRRNGASVLVSTHAGNCMTSGF